MNELDLARELADIADEISMGYFGKAPGSSLKLDGSIVTVADHEIEDALRKRIGEEFPEHGIAGEEAGVHGDRAAPVWVIDPIDGTANFAAAIPVFATLIGLRVNARTEVGVVSAPALNERYEAAKGDGARMNGAPITVSSVSTLEAAAVCFGSAKRMERRGYADQMRKILAGCKRDRGFGDFWGHMLVARGALEVMTEPSLQAWDVLPLEIIVKEAGGEITTLDGAPYPEEKLWGPGPRAGCLTTNGVLHKQIVDLLNSRD
ncbi:MAG: inositol monophosphatase family protein [Actinomycetota bacterium]